MLTQTIIYDRFKLSVAPDTGGAVIGFTLNDRPILRTAFDPATPRDCAAFPLIPFASRITNGHFDFQGRSIQLAPNFPPEPHAIHGNGWQVPWHVRSETKHSLTLCYDHDGSDWPWRFHAAQKFTLSADGLTLELQITNKDQIPMPAGLGWHPYFPKAHATLTANAGKLWHGGKLQQPTQTQDLSVHRNVNDIETDAVYQWPAREALISINGFDIHMRASDIFGYLIAYTPVGEDFFCIEPVSHAPDAVNLNVPQTVSGLRVLAPEETLSGTIALKVTTP